MASFQDLGVRAIVKDIGKFLGDVGRMNSAVKTAGQNMQRVGRGMTQAGTALTAGLTLPIVAIGGGAIKMASDFETAFTEVTTLFDLPKEQVNTLREDVLALSKTMGIDPVESAKAMYQAISAGVPAANVIGFLNENVKLAVGGVSDLETVVDVTTTVMNAWGKTTEDITDIQDSLFLAVRQGKTTVGELGQSFFQVAPVAAAFNLKIDEVNAVLATLALNGTPTAEAFTQIRSAIVSLGAPTIRQRKRLDEMGISFSEAEFAERGFISIARELFEATGGNKEQLRKLLGSIEAVNAVLVIGGQGYETATRFLGEYETKAGKAEEAFDKMNATFGRQVTLLKTELKVAFIKLGAALIPIARAVLKAFRVFLKIMDQVITVFTKLPKPLQIAIVAFFALLAALGPVLLILGTLLTAMGAFVFLMPSLSTAILFVAVAFAAAIPFIVGFIGVMLLAAGIASIIITNWEPLTKFFGDTLPEAFEAGASVIEGAFDGIGRQLASFAASAIRLGANIIIAVGKGIAGAAQGLFNIIAKVVVGIITLLNPANWVVGSSMDEAYAAAGESAVRSMVISEKDEFERLSKFLTDAVVEPIEEAMEETEEVAEEGGEAAGNAFLSALEDIVTRSMGAVTSALAAPLEAMRGVVQSLASELQRLAGLPSVESAEEALERAQLGVQEAALRPALRAAREARDRIRDIDDEVDALVEKREELIRLAQGHTAESDAVDDEIRSLVKEKEALDASAKKTEDQADAIQMQIAALNDLAASREAERAVAVARAQIADKTLATDQEIIVALGRMEPIIREVTSAINAQVGDLQTRFIPAWEDAASAIAGAGGGGAVGAPEVGDLGEIDFSEINQALTDALADIESPLENMITDIEKFFKKVGPTLAFIGLGILFGLFFSWNIGLPIIIGAVIGLLIITFKDEINSAFSAIAEFITGALGTISGAFSNLPRRIEEVIGSIVDVLLFPFKTAKNLLIGDPLVGDIIAGIVAFFFGLPLQIVEALISLVPKLLEVWIGVQLAVIGFIVGLIGDIVGLFIGLPGAILEGITGAIGPLLGFFAGLPGMLLGAIGDIAGSFFSLGADIIGGLVSGITSIDIGGVVSGLAGELTGAVDDLTGGVAGDIVGGLKSLSPFAHGAFEIPGAGGADSVPGLLTPGEMVVPRGLAEMIRSQVGSFQGLADLVSGRSGGSAALAGVMGATGMRDQLEAMPARSSVASTVSVNAPISVTIQARSWEEIRRLVTSEVDTALEDARRETVRAGAEIGGGIL